jgi:DnaJ-class molecular chaperone
LICETCEGEGYVRGQDARNPGALVMLPCLECNGSGIASPPSFICPRCGRESFNLNDIRERYCGDCHQFVDDLS